MKRILLPLQIVFVCALLLGTHKPALAKASASVDPALKVATVNGEPITWLELRRTIAASHELGPAKTKAGRVDFTFVLQRMINTRLIVLEAKNIGLNETSGLKKAVDAYAKELQAELLLEQHVEDIKPDDGEVQKIYESLVREWKIKALRVKKEDDAKKIDAQIKDGKDFEQIAQRALQWRGAEGDPEGAYLKTDQLRPPVAEVISQMETGSISPVLSLGKDGYIVFKLEGTRIPPTEDPRARKTAYRKAWNEARVKAARQYYENLKKEYVKLDQALIDDLDYESEVEAMEKLLADKRVIAEIRGDSSITVADLSKALKERFFHGIKLAVEAKRINAKKSEVLEDMLQRRVLRLVALKEGIDQKADFKSRVKEYENSAIFEAFLKKILYPEIKLDQKDLENYYNKHQDEFTSPTMMRIKDLVFAKRDDAVAAMQQINKGTDFAWLSANAPGQVAPDTEGLINFESRPLTISGMPQDIQKAVSGARLHDSRLYESTAGHFYMLYVDQIIEPVKQPFASVKEEIAKQVFSSKVKEGIERWADQLSKYYPVKIFKEAIAQLQ